MYEFIEVERENALTIITINRPAAHNALNAAAHRELEAAFDAWEYPAMKAMLASDDFIEGPLAFAEKRAPRWKSHTP
jgi:crotonobetainyl-CoA hydratase